jgi:hypothetical protein
MRPRQFLNGGQCRELLAEQVRSSPGCRDKLK